MALDEYGNYRADLDDCCIAVLPQSGAQIQIGYGAPTSSTPISPIYIDSSTDTIYINPGLTHDGWVVVTGGGGGSSQITSGVGSPITNGISVIVYKIYLDITIPAAPSVWMVSAGAWVQVIA